MTPDDRPTSDDRIAALFREAASDLPPPEFGRDDVVLASRRISARRRSVVAAVAVAVVVAVPVAVLPHHFGPTDVADPVAGAGLPAGGSGSLLVAGSEDPPLGPGTGTCANPQDPALRKLLERVLPEAATATEGASSDICRLPAERFLSLQVSDNGVAGVLGVSYLPPGATDKPPAGAASRPTRSGGTVSVYSFPDGTSGPAPFADRLPSLAAYLAPRL